MLEELHVSQLGLIDDLSVLFGPGMTALTGETGAGKTLIVEAIELLLGVTPEPHLVRHGAAEAVVEGRFRLGSPVAGTPHGLQAGRGGDGRGGTEGHDAEGHDAEGHGTGGHGTGGHGAEGHEEAPELILRRVVPSRGRSRAYLNGAMAASAALALAAGELVDLHGQHAHQSLLAPSAQREALDLAAGTDRQPLDAARRRLSEICRAQEALGGDARSRAREIDLLSFQLDELDSADLRDPEEDRYLREEEDALANSEANRRCAQALYEALAGEDGVADRLGSALRLLAGAQGAGAGARLASAISPPRPQGRTAPEASSPFSAIETRLRELVAEVADLTSDARSLGERLQDDPQRLAEIGARRKLLGDLRRKYGESLAEVMAYAERARLRREELLSFEERAQALETQRRHAEAELVTCEEALGRARRAGAPEFSAKVQHRLGELAMPRARLEVVVEGRAGEEVCWMLGANPGEPTLPLAKVASGGELARAMLAARLVLGDSGAEVGWRRKTLVFDEVDAGIGGEAALAVGHALAVLAQHHQVLVVTHLAQVAAFADHHLQVSKKVGKGRTVARLVALEGEERLVELSRMLSGSPNSSAARTHAGELLARRALVRPFPTPSALP